MKKWVFLAISGLSVLFLNSIHHESVLAGDLDERLSCHLAPRIFLQIQGYATSDGTMEEAANWDLLVLDAELVANKPDFLGSQGKVRTINPNAVILFYFSAGDVIPWVTDAINAGFINGLRDEWYMKDVTGARYQLFFIAPVGWTLMLNQTTGVNAHLPSYLNQNVLSKNLGDGIFYDWMMNAIAWLNDRSDNPNGPLDIDNDGLADSAAKLDSMWTSGMNAMLSNSLATFPRETLVLGNGGWLFDDTFKDKLNGMMVENFLEGEAQGLEGFGWHEVMRGHWLAHQVARIPKTSLLMANGDQNNSAFMRFALASVLMFDGYFCYTNKGTYGSPWWYDEYAVNNFTGQAVKSLRWKGYLGQPVNEAYQPDNPNVLLKTLLFQNDPSSTERAWRRDFEYGTALVNPSAADRPVNLNSSFRKISGVNDPAFNNGQAVTMITLAPKSGAVLLNYQYPKYSLTVQATPADGGRIVKSPDLTSYDYETSVRLEAIASPGFVFMSWSGDISSGNEKDNPLQLTMDDHKTLTANFVRMKKAKRIK